MIEGPMVDALKYGALGLSLCILVVTAAFLKAELARPEPRSQARNLILIFMGFSVLLFAGATYIEISKRTNDVAQINALNDLKAKQTQKLNDIKNAVAQMRGSMNGKVQITLTDIPENQRRNIDFFERQLCGSLDRLETALEMTSNQRCNLTKP